MKRHISKMHPSSIVGEYLPKTTTIGPTSNVYSPPVGSTNYPVDFMWRMLLSQKLEHPSSLVGEYLPKTSTIGPTSNVYSPPVGSTNYPVDFMWRMLLSQKLDHIMDLQRTTNDYLANIFFAITLKK